MDQVWFGTRATTTPNSGTRFNSVIGGIGWATTEAPVQMVCPSSGKIKALKVSLEDAPGSSKSWALALMVDGVASALTVTVSDSAVTGSDLSNEVSVSAGQIVSMRSVPSGTPTPTAVFYTMVFAGDTDKESVLMTWANAIALNSGADEYAPIQVGPVTSRSTTELDMQQVIPGPGTIKNLYVQLSADPGASPEAYRFTLRKGGVSQSLTVTITANDTTGNDTANSFTVVAGDLCNVLIEPLNTPTVTPNMILSVTFVADTDGESLVLGGVDDDIHTSSTEDILMMPFTDQSWGTGESSERTILDTCVFKNLYVNLENAPGVGNSFLFKPRTLLDSASDPSASYSDGNLSVTISDAATTGNDTSNKDSLVPGASIVMRCVPTSSPTVGQAKWGVVMFIDLKLLLGRGSLITKLQAAGII